MLNNKKLNILAVDVGNTSIHLGFFNKSKLQFKDRVSTHCGKQNLKVFFDRLERRIKIRIDAVIVSSVVSSLDKVLRSALKNAFKTRVFFCGKDLIIPITNLYKNPKAPGQDRLLNAFAAFKFYGKPLIIVDFGTALTFDLVSKAGAYIGGIIAPGINLSLKALSDNTDFLPQFSLKHKPRQLRLIGKTTKDSMFSAAIFGFSAMAQGLIKQLKADLGANTKVILTGGDSKIIAAYLKACFDILDEDLTLKGLNLLSCFFIKRP